MARLLPIAIGIVVWVFILIAYFMGRFTYHNRSRRKREPGFEYVHVEEDGSARELDADEREYLTTEFHPADSGRPYIKFTYEAKTPDDRLDGFLERRKLPKNIAIKPARDAQG